MSPALLLLLLVLCSAASFNSCSAQKCEADDLDSGSELFLLQTEMTVNHKSIKSHAQEAQAIVHGKKASLQEEKEAQAVAHGKKASLKEEKDAQAVAHSKKASLKEETTGQPWSFYNCTVPPLLIVTVIVAWFMRPQLDSPSDEATFNDPRFKTHRFSFLAVWAVCVSADWLQGPYVYSLYSSFGYSKDSINKLFVVGFLSSMVFGTFVGSLADAWGRKRTALLYCILYIFSCSVVHCSLYPVLMLGRVAGGIATSLLFSTFECWMVGEHNGRHQFSAALLRYMFSMMYFVNYLVAILTGLVAQVFVDGFPLRRIDGYVSLHYGGNICAYDIAILMLCIAIPLICLTWGENYGDFESNQTTMESYKAALNSLTSSWKVASIGVVIACFEGGMYAFVINWTPTLTMDGAPSPPHGLIFSTMMMCCMMGSAGFSLLSSKVNSARVVVVACVIATCSFSFLAMKCGQPSFVAAIYCSLLCFEACVGLYFPSMGSLKSELVPEESRASIYNCYRVPLNIVVVSIILTDLPLRMAYAVCAVLMVAAVGILMLIARAPPSGKISKSEEVTEAC